MSEVRNAHWENHNKILIGGLQRQFEQKELCDCIIVAEGQSLEAHKVILAACSPFFKSLFLQSRGKDVFVLHRDIKFRELKTLIEFVYYGDLRFCDDTIEELMIAAEILQIRGLQGRSKACFQSTKKEVGEGECSTKYCKNVRFDSYQKNKKPSHHQITVTDGSVPKEGNEWSECYNECYPQGTDPNHVETLEVPQVPGVLTRQQGITAQILEMREGVTSDSENINWTAKNNI
ncbi:GL23182 [Gryllus bimaculatus]|nr:GL23182 [Gryllus bimaculatus]